MAARDVPRKNANATAVLGGVDLELGSRDRITPMQSTPDESPSKAATPSGRRSPEVHSPAAESRNGQGGASRRRRISQKMPRPLARWGHSIVAWLKGPKPPRVYRIVPFFERWQTFPARVLARLPRTLRICFFGLACLVWVVLFSVIIKKDNLQSDIGGLGAPLRLSCVTTLWSSPQACGLDGRNCLPFSNSSFAFNCPAACLSAQVLNPRSIGSTIVNYRSLVVGGASDGSSTNQPVYRGDSFICGAAIHAGAIKNREGGCGIVSLMGERSSFGAINRNGISSIGFDSPFPMSFAFATASSVNRLPMRCHDPRWNLLIVSTVFTVLFGLFTTRPATFFGPTFTMMFFQVSMASDPPAYASYASLASTTIGRFLPAALIAALFYGWIVRKTLTNCRANVEKTVLWVGGAWVGALGNYTFDKIPLQRLTGHDIRQQPGAITALIIIIFVLFGLALNQAWSFRNEGRLLRLLALYAALGVGLGVLAAFPKLNLRIHHYILALLLLPGTAIQTRASLLCQGLLVGLFVNGVARWGFDSILQTAAALRGDAQLGSGVPSILEPEINGMTIRFVWKGLVRGYEGVSVLVNDVERFRGSSNDGSGIQTNSFTWTRRALDEPEYFRFGFVNYQPFGVVSYSDFTKAGIWWPNSTWSGIMPGRT